MKYLGNVVSTGALSVAELRISDVLYFVGFWGLGNKKANEKICNKLFRIFCSYFERGAQNLFIVTESKNAFFLYTK